MLAPLFALLAALSFAGSTICVRRGTEWSNPLQGVRLGIFAGLPIFALLSLLSGEMGHLGQLPWKAYVLFPAHGLVHLALGSVLAYFAIQAIGGSRAMVVVTAAPLFSVAGAILLFGEEVTWALAIGASLAMLGPLLMVQGEGRTGASGPGTLASSIAPAAPVRGIVLAFGAAVMFGVGPILIKGGLDAANFPILGIFMSYSAASLLIGIPLVSARPRHGLTHMDRRGVRWYLLAGLLLSLAILLYFLALSRGAVAVVSPLMQAQVFFVFLLTFLMNRHLEALNLNVIAGGLVVAAGTALIVSQG